MCQRGSKPDPSVANVTTNQITSGMLLGFHVWQLYVSNRFPILLNLRSQPQADSLFGIRDIFYGARRFT